MPTLLRSGPFRIFFYASDRGEPPHVHVEHDDCEAKFWLDPVRLSRSYGFSTSEINTLERLVAKHQKTFLEQWHDFFRH